MTRDDLRLLLDYHYWARDRVLEAVAPLTSEQFTRRMDSSFSSIRDTLVHTLSAEHIWYARWQGEVPAGHLDPEAFPVADRLRTAWNDHEPRVRAYLEGLSDADLDGRLEYRLLDGTSSASVRWQMIQHVVNHASYHRGQVTTLLRQIGAKPPSSMDLIAFYRLRDAQAKGGR